MLWLPRLLRQGIGVYFQVPRNYQVSRAILTAKSNKSKEEYIVQSPDGYAAYFKNWEDKIGAFISERVTTNSLPEETGPAVPLTAGAGSEAIAGLAAAIARFRFFGNIFRMTSAISTWGASTARRRRWTALRPCAPAGPSRREPSSGDG
jgi:hypothetical protein